jgi:hypothetical protein
MPQPEPWSAVAFNPVPESENRIHADDVAHAYGFRGGLVPGVTVSAYLLHPAALAWQRDWLERGRAHVVIHSPVYDGERFRVEVDVAEPDSYSARLIDERGTHCATAEAALPPVAPEPPARRGDPPLTNEYVRPVASREVMEALMETGLHSMPARWDETAEITRYLLDPSAMAPVFRDEGLANPAFILGLSNWVLGNNVRMSPWLHLETHSQHHGAIEPGTELVVEASLADLFEKKGHGFLDAEVVVFRQPDDAAVASIRLRAIYRLRAPDAEGRGAPTPRSPSLHAERESTR